MAPELLDDNVDGVLRPAFRLLAEPLEAGTPTISKTAFLLSDGRWSRYRVQIVATGPISVQIQDVTLHHICK